MTTALLIIIGFLFAIIGGLYHFFTSGAEVFTEFLAAFAGVDFKEERLIFPYVMYVLSFLTILGGIIYGVYW